MKEIKKALRRYLFLLVVIGCVSFVIVGTVTAWQRTRYNSDFEAYDTIRMEDESGYVVFHSGEKELKIKKIYEDETLRSVFETVIRYFD